MYGAYGHQLSLKKHAFFVLYMYSRHPNSIKNIQGVSKHMGCPSPWEISKHTGGIQTYVVYPNIWGISKHTGASKHMWWVSNIWRPSEHTGGVQTYRGLQMYGAYGHPLSLIKHTFFVLSMYRRHPNIIKTYRGHPKYVERCQTYGASKHMGCPNIQGAFLHAFLFHKAGLSLVDISKYYQLFHLYLGVMKSHPYLGESKVSCLSHL